MSVPPLFALLLSVSFAACAPPAAELETSIRFATINVEDLRTDDLLNPDHPRLRLIARQLQMMRPDVVLVNEIAYDQPGVPGFREGDESGLNGARLASILAISQDNGFEPLRYRAFMAPSNTGQASGYDLDHDGRAVMSYPQPLSAGPDGSPAAQTPDGRAYGNDNWGFGTFPGQYAMALLVREDLEIVENEVRTFQHFRWSQLPGALRPTDAESGEPWYPDEVWEQFPLSSKSHWDIPVRLPDGRVVHVLASHPTPPAFDGPERRNKNRNHDEIRFWSAYLDGSDAIIDDGGSRGGLAAGEQFVIMGDLNADPDEGDAVDNPIGTWLLSHPRVNGDFVPKADSTGVAAFPQLDADDTARWFLRVDYVLPSTGLEVLAGGIERPSSANAPETSDHFPVWIDIALQ